LALVPDGLGTDSPTRAYPLGMLDGALVARSVRAGPYRGDEGGRQNIAIV